MQVHLFSEINPMTALLQEKAATNRNAIELMVTHAIDRQLESLPGEVVKSINKASAIAYVLNCVSPLQGSAGEDWLWEQERTRETLGTLIADAATLSLIRLLCQPLMTLEQVGEQN